MLVLGIDPGTNCTGYGLVEKKGNALRMVAYGAITCPRGEDIAQRLERIFDGLTEVIEKYRPDVIALEKAFYSKSVSSTMRIGEARAMAILCSAKAKLPLFEYAPAMVKRAVSGSGRGHKTQVLRMVCMLLGLKEEPKPEDASDALSIAICHIHRESFRDVRSLVK